MTKYLHPFRRGYQKIHFHKRKQNLINLPLNRLTKLAYCLSNPIGTEAVKESGLLCHFPPHGEFYFRNKLNYVSKFNTKIIKI